jgi:hypothetical protein
MTTHIHTAIHARHDVLSVWCSAMQQMTAGVVVSHVHYSDSEPPCGDVRAAMPHIGIGAASYVVRTRMGGVGVFVESDIIPVVEWSPDDYPGCLRVLEGSPGKGWFGLTIARGSGPHELIPQRYVRDGGCPDWLPADLCEPALAANAKVVGAHFLHLDKMSRRPELSTEKNALLDLLRQRFGPPRPGLGDMVAAGLSAVGITPERVSAALGVEDCGCKKRQQQLNELGRRLGIG